MAAPLSRALYRGKRAGKTGKKIRPFVPIARNTAEPAREGQDGGSCEWISNVNYFTLPYSYSFYHGFPGWIFCPCK